MSNLKATESLYYVYDRFAVPAGPVFLQAWAPVRHLRILCAGHWLSDTENIMRTARHGRGRGDEHGSRLQTRQQVATTATACLRAMLALYEQSAGALSYRMTSSWRTSRRLRWRSRMGQQATEEVAGAV